MTTYTVSRITFVLVSCGTRAAAVFFWPARRKFLWFDDQLFSWLFYLW